LHKVEISSIVFFGNPFYAKVLRKLKEVGSLLYIKLDAFGRLFNLIKEISIVKKTAKKLLSALKISYFDINGLKENQNNPRVHTDKQIKITA